MFQVDDRIGRTVEGQEVPDNVPMTEVCCMIARQHGHTPY